MRNSTVSVLIIVFSSTFHFHCTCCICDADSETLLYLPGYPESGNHTADLAKPYFSHFVNWYPNRHHINSWPCHGKCVRTVCVFGPGDLPLLASVPHLFANKFYWDYERYARDCMEELIFNRTRDEYLRKIEFDVGFYKGLGFVNNKVE